MYVYLLGKMDYLRNIPLYDLLSSYEKFHDFTYSAFFFVDLLIVTVGYICTFRLFDSHVRSTEPTFLGWFVALVCYQPF